MKKTLKKIAILTSIFLFTHLSYADTPSTTKITTLPGWAIPNVKASTFKKFDFSRLLGLGNSENLKSYHYGLKTLNPSHKIPTAYHLLHSIRSHSAYKGNLSKEPAENHYLSLLEENNQPFFIYEVCQNGEKDFYLAHLKGVRHFTINRSGEKWDQMGSLDNATHRNYPTLNHFILCTIG